MLFSYFCLVLSHKDLKNTDKAKISLHNKSIEKEGINGKKA